jgi:hypothetical protein
MPSSTGEVALFGVATLAALVMGALVFLSIKTGNSKYQIALYACALAICIGSNKAVELAGVHAIPTWLLLPLIFASAIGVVLSFKFVYWIFTQYLA